MQTRQSLDDGDSPSLAVLFSLSTLLILQMHACVLKLSMHDTS